MKENVNKPYFNEDINSKIRAMSDSERDSLLLGLEGTRYWIAILKYNQSRSNFCQNGLVTTDATKEPGKMCQLQGIMLGLSDLQNAVITLKEKNQETEESSEGK